MATGPGYTGAHCLGGRAPADGNPTKARLGLIAVFVTENALFYDL